MFSPHYRDALRERLVHRAMEDPRIVAAAAVGSSAAGGDRWSDLDLTFGVTAETSVPHVLDEWTRFMVDDEDAAVLFDLPSGTSIYRVFLLPGALQVDLSFTPETDFGARGPRFTIIFGEVTEQQWSQAPAPSARFGLGVHHVVRAHICIQRKRPWQAEYWIHLARDEALSLACGRLGLSESHGRGFDLLPPHLQERFAQCLVHSLDAGELRRALSRVADALLDAGSEGSGQVERVRPMLRDLIISGG